VSTLNCSHVNVSVIVVTENTHVEVTANCATGMIYIKCMLPAVAKCD
jgi:hypothetical protein